MGRQRGKITRTFTFSPDIVEYISYLAVTYEASLKIEELIRRSAGFKKFQKELKHGNQKI